ncbi:plant cysteine oxidase 1-like [Setaria viridis]|uniref:plant cysteine oxidase 1-like n=1 Tax=Setaria viridis TaxID=4556 RepID=UPI003B3B211D
MPLQGSKVAGKSGSSIGVFCFPQSAVIPLHDHPGMTVFCKILLGSMHIKSYDWVMASSASNQLNTDAIFDATSKIVVLYPEDGETCTVQRVSPCAVLDVMGPPYCLEEGRDCFYFSSEVAGGDGQYAWLNKVPCTIEMDADQNSGSSYVTFAVKQFDLVLKCRLDIYNISIGVW